MIRFVVAGLAALTVAMTARAAEAPVSVMVVGMFHMGSPGRDMHNMQVDDVLSDRRQGEIKSAVDGLAKLPYDAVDAYAKAHGQAAILDAASASRKCRATGSSNRTIIFR